MARSSLVMNTRGVDLVIRFMRRAGAKANLSLKRGLFAEAEMIMGDAKRIVPVKTSNLRNSGHVELPEESHGRVLVRVGFGGPAGTGNHSGEVNDEEVGYAVYVHEDLTASHSTGQQAKYLSEPAENRTRGMPIRLARRIRDEVLR